MKGLGDGCCGSAGGGSWSQGKEMEISLPQCINIYQFLRNISKNVKLLIYFYFFIGNIQIFAILFIIDNKIEQINSKKNQLNFNTLNFERLKSLIFYSMLIFEKFHAFRKLENHYL